MAILETLNKEQKQAVTHETGPLLIVAGAGTGKTTVLINRLLYLIVDQKVDSENILITTFTEKAASEMTERADEALPYGYTDLWIHTFHGLCEKILRNHSLDIGIGSDFKLLTSTEQWVLIKQNIEKFNLDYYKPLGNPNKFIKELIKHFSGLKDENITTQEYLEYAEGLKADKDNELNGQDKAGVLDIDKVNELANAYHIYNQLLLDNSYLDFGDLICYTLKLFKERPNILKQYQEKFKYVMVDEFQDTNWSQYELIKLLAKPDDSLIAVGDDDQAIYRFRGASLSNILQFKDDYPQAKEIVLNKNYRSGQEILDASYNFIKHNNPNRLEVRLGLEKNLISPLDKHGKIEYLSFTTEREESQGIVSKIKELVQEPETNWSDFAILVRANATADSFTKELTRQEIPNLFVSLKGLYYKPIILDVLAYFKLLDNYHESSALFRVLSMEIFKVGYADIVNINKFARSKYWSLYEALKNIEAIPKISPEGVANINKLKKYINKHFELVKNSKPSKVYVNFVRDCLAAELDRDKDLDQFNYLNQLYRKIITFENNNEDVRIKDFVSLIDLEMESGETGSLSLNYEDSDTVKIMTIHSAKGLEFKNVFLVNLVDKKFPTIRRKDLIPLPDALVKEVLPEGDVHIEEERRLFYVAMTRAKENLFLTAAKDYGGAREKKPSKFLEEANVLNVKKEKKEEKTKEKKSNDLLRDLEESTIQNQEKIIYDLPTKFSFSQVQAFNNCPLQYKFAHILKIPTESGATAIFGRLMHDCLREFLTPLLNDSLKQSDLFIAGDQVVKNKELITLKRLLDIYKEKWNDYGYKDKQESENYHKKGTKMLTGFYNDLENSIPSVLFLEKSFNLKISEYQLRGGIDRIDQLVDGTVEIIDYKTGKPKEKLVYQDKKQLLIYQIALEEVFGLKVSELSFYYLEDSTKISFTAKDKDLEKIKLEVKETIDKIKQMQFNAKPGMLCGFCDFNTICEFRNGK